MKNPFTRKDHLNIIPEDEPGIGNSHDEASLINKIHSRYSKHSSAIESIPLYDQTIPSYDESVIQPLDYAKNLIKNPVSRSKSYLVNLFPIARWLPYYPTRPKWILSDFITGVSVAIVLVPQAMSYAKLAGLPPQYGLYSSFIGLMMYSIFATSKDVSIGPVAVMSLEVSKIIDRIQDKYPGIYSAPEIGTTVALLCGAITLAVGLLRLGFLVELIPLPAVMAFTTGSAFNIITSQLPGLMGFSDLVNTHEAPYLIVIHFLQNLKHTKVDAAFGLVGLFILYIWKFTAQHMIDRYPQKALIWTYVLNVRTAIVIIFSTLISFLIIRHDKEHSPFAVTGFIESGLHNIGVFTPPNQLASRIAPDLPVATIVLVLEHISIAKSFGRVHDYKINPNQEFIAIGVTNLVGTFFHAYPATGSFSRTALASKCGVKTPFASVFAGFCVLIAIYCFTSAFYYIPKATLCAIIIHAVSDLMASYKSTLRLFLVQPLDCAIFLIGVLIAVFSSIENGIYFAMCASAALIIWRMCWTNGVFMGRIKVVQLVNPTIIKESDSKNKNELNNNLNDRSFSNSGLLSMPDSFMSVGSCNKGAYGEDVKTVNTDDGTSISYMYRWVPMNKKSMFNLNFNNSSNVHTRYINDNVCVQPPPPGIVVYRMSESFIYPNSSAQVEHILDYVKNNFHSSKDANYATWNNIHEIANLNYSLPQWNPKSMNFKNLMANVKNIGNKSNEEFVESNKDTYSKNNSTQEQNQNKSKLNIIHLDFSQVVAIDATSIQALIDMKRAITLFTDSPFEIHFSGIINPWVIHGLVNAGFGGKVNSDNIETFNSDNNVDENEIEPDIEEDRFNESENRLMHEDLEMANVNSKSPNDDTKNVDKYRYIDAALSGDNVLYPLNGTNFPHFHFDIPSYSEYDQLESINY